ncbi:MAG TPA: hypothetical protein ENI34_02510 [candidate division WOR-3 bacterium]|uniref:Uncharacterized protein n=1 Tax=candidate division WOR-3 bacterium TaxID=2052148 RepID=A0A9C9EL82_UNCW3|nr:hypothetical protein [candidate division WOR-3 bacterium]
MATHLENIEDILSFIAKDTSAETMLDALYKKIRFLVERYIVLRDAENFTAYFKFLLSTDKLPKELVFNNKLIQAFINRTYADSKEEIQNFRGDILYRYLSKSLVKGAEIKAGALDELENIIKREKAPSLEILKERVRIAMILKWLQGPLETQLSGGLRDYITFLATIYGQYKTDRVYNVDWQPYDISDEDMAVLNSEYAVFELSLMEAIKLIREARARKPRSNNYKDQFRIVLISLDNLVRLAKKGELDSPHAFRDKMIVATTLIYIQDEFVEKDPELKKLIQLFVSLYYQFRDKHYTSVEKKRVGIKES